ncbi:hypothetical protein ACTI_83380 [Actinoplanes sp. OR16]|uniref:NACHT domain-containing protein n=1 Tax=Actinoplanes sp. OR16 TaxID=946334 RepID=UPI000F703FF3|nr:NACHT domain-containing protein [Actinoplanes sp. OR16]BBH71653.1 hypothetical protein ACTI_83380 [Actinoplanes sp. OR16]
MGRGLLRFLQIVFGTVAGLVIVPVAVNIGTGGEPPEWMRPFVTWLWPVAGICVVVVAVLEYLSRRDDRPPPSMVTLHPDDPRNAPLALAQVTHYIKGRRKVGLDERVRIALDLDERPETVRQTVHLVRRLSGDEFQLSDQHGIADVFDEMGGSLLILGAPGAGKTTLLLDLAAMLAERDDEDRIPVVVDLADWSRSGSSRLALFGRGQGEPRDFTAWLLSSLRRRYQIPAAVGQAWLRADRLILLLDGLDEVRESHRDRCVAEINRLQEERRVTRVVVCSREGDYTQLGGRLRLQGAVSIRPLTRDQVMTYFDRVSPFFARTVEALRHDDELWELLTTPLMLHIMALAQSDATISRATEGNRRDHIFDAYLIEVLARHRSSHGGTPEHALRALQLLAEGSRKSSAGVRVISPDSDNYHEIVSSRGGLCGSDRILPLVLFAWSIAVVAAVAARTTGVLAVGVAALFTYVLIQAHIGAKWSAAPVRRPLALAVTTLTLDAVVLGVMAAAVRAGDLIEVRSRPVTAGLAAAAVVAAVAVVWTLFKSWKWAGAIGVAGSLLVAAVLRFGLAHQAIEGWIIGLAAMTTLVLQFALMLDTPDDSGAAPSRVFRWTYLSASVIGMLAAVLAFSGVWFDSIAAGVVGFLLGAVAGLLPGGLAGVALSAPAVKISMYIAGDPVPWRRRFLAFAADRSILTHTEGEYRFIHLLIRDHLADCDPLRLAAMVDKRRAELPVA